MRGRGAGVLLGGWSRHGVIFSEVVLSKRSKSLGIMQKQIR